jgi:hypothetical protein
VRSEHADRGVGGGRRRGAVAGSRIAGDERGELRQEGGEERRLAPQADGLAQLLAVGGAGAGGVALFERVDEVDGEAFLVGGVAELGGGRLDDGVDEVETGQLVRVGRFGDELFDLVDDKLEILKERVRKSRGRRENRARREKGIFSSLSLSSLRLSRVALCFLV